jgi:hypothetical protein
MNPQVKTYWPLDTRVLAQKQTMVLLPIFQLLPFQAWVTFY